VKKLGFSPYFNRELSWLAFNSRVIEEAQDERYPLLERLKFISIVSSNLDEFFMIRVASLERKAKRTPTFRGVDGAAIEEVLSQIREWVLAQKSKQGEVLKQILDKLKEEGLYLQNQILPTDTEILARAKSLLPEIKIQTFTKLESLNQFAGGKIFVFARLKDKFAILSLPENFDRLILLPPELSQAKTHYVLAEKLLVSAAASYFENETLLETFPFKLIRDGELKIDPDTDPEDLLTTVEEAIPVRAKLPVVRLEVDAPHIADGALLLANAFKLHSRAVYRYDTPMDLKILWRIYNLPELSRLRFPEPGNQNDFLTRVPDLVKIIRGQDILLHHPYDSFETVVKLLEAAAVQKNVVAIRQTLYRTNKNSPIVAALIQAAKMGKSVTAFVELRARFDEAHNIQLSKELKKYGVKVLRGYSDKKIHCKMTQILVKEDDQITSFVHIGTGNYNPNTAKLYTDLGLLTSDRSFGRDAEKVFKFIQGGRLPKQLEAFISAPRQLHKCLLLWIRNETKRAKRGDKDALIIAKINSLVDTELVDALYKASQAGVKIELIVRGICVLKPGVPGLSENIRVISIVERYLEHSRIYYFQNGEHPSVYLSSADWMPRNFHTRLEIAFPIYDGELKKYVRDVILENFLKDNQKARQLMPDGQWVQLQPKPGEIPLRAQEVFEELAKQNYKGTPLFSRFRLQVADNLEIPKVPEQNTFAK
jgi:polyphosphate kinase